MTVPDPEFRPSWPRVGWPRRARRRLWMGLPLLVWLGAIFLVVSMLRERPRVVELRGIAEPIRYTIRAPIDGVLTMLAVRENQDVGRGEILGRFDDTELRLRLARARAEVERGRSEIAGERARLEHESRQRGLELDIDHRSEVHRLQRDVDDARLQALQTRASIEESRIRKDGLAVELRRVIELQRGGIASDSRLNELRTEHDALERRIQELSLVFEEQGLLVETRRRRRGDFLARQSETLDLEREILEPLRWQLRAQETELEEISHAIENLRLTAPAAGRIESIALRAGERLSAGETLITIVEPRVREILAYFPAHYRDGLGPEIKVEIAPEFADSSFVETRVTSISPALVLVPKHLWLDPRIEEWALVGRLAATGNEVPGQNIHVRWRDRGK